MKMYEVITTFADGSQSAMYYESKAEARAAADNDAFTHNGTIRRLTAGRVDVVKCFVLDIDHMGQKSGLYKQCYIPTLLIVEHNGLLWLRIENVHESGYISPAGQTLLYTDEEQAQRAALS